MLRFHRIDEHTQRRIVTLLRYSVQISSVLFAFTHTHNSCKQCKFTTNRHNKIQKNNNNKRNKQSELQMTQKQFLKHTKNCECAHFSSSLCMRMYVTIVRCVFANVSRYCYFFSFCCCCCCLSLSPFICALYLSIVCCVNGFVNSLSLFVFFFFKYFWCVQVSILLCVNWRISVAASTARVTNVNAFQTMCLWVFALR